MSTLILVCALLQAMPATAASGRALTNNPRLEGMNIEIWPEYDRPAALVILRAELAKDAALPAAVSLRIPASSGGAAAVAYAAEEHGQLFNLKYERTEAKDFVNLRFSVPDRFFHIEFYDDFLKGTSEREYKYVWPGDLAVGRINVVVQEPAAASDFSILPKLNDSAGGAGGMRYWSAQLGAFELGKQVPVQIRYAKSDSRTSQEILKLGAPEAVPAATQEPETGDRSTLLLALGIGVPLLAAWTAYFLWRWRARSAAERPSGAGFCRQCGTRIASGDRFCSRCGAALA